MLHFPALEGRAAPPAIASVCVFGGAHDGRDRGMAAATAALGRAIGRAGLRLVYGGGDDGLMACAARAAFDHGSEIVAIAPRFFTERAGWSSPYGKEIVPDMATRKRLMFDYADAFIALPGGIGTIEELAEVVTLAKLGRHAKPIVLANFGGFWDPWLDLLAHLAAAGFTDVCDRSALVDEPEGVLAALGHRPAIAAGEASPLFAIGQARRVR
jgi:uncharacterized protein (TIGR00730 family)